MSKEKIAMFLQAFAKLEQNVLWKFEAELENVPKNVMISKWLPQSDVLGKIPSNIEIIEMEYKNKQKCRDIAQIFKHR